MKSLNQFITSKEQRSIEGVLWRMPFIYLSRAHKRQSVCTETQIMPPKGLLLHPKRFFICSPWRDQGGKEDTENICLFLTIPWALKMFGNLLQWLPTRFCIKNKALGKTARVFHGLKHTGHLHLPRLLQSLQATLNYLLSAQLTLLPVQPFENVRQLYSLLGILSFSSKLSQAFTSSLQRAVLPQGWGGFFLYAPFASALALSWHLPRVVILCPPQVLNGLWGPCRQGLPLFISLGLALCTQCLAHTRGSVNICVCTAYPRSTEVAQKSPQPQSDWWLDLRVWNNVFLWDSCGAVILGQNRKEVRDTALSVWQAGLP